MTFINAKDVAEPPDLAEPGASCWIKMTRPSFDALITAFKDPDSRVRLNHEVAEHHYTRIEAVGIDGGYLDGLRIRFSDHLNTAIGGRGTGKSTLLECLRYALDLDHKGQDARKQGERIVKQNLGPAGTIAVTLVSAANHGARYQVKRRFGEPPRVIDADLSDTALDGLPHAEILRRGRALLDGIRTGAANAVEQLRGQLDRAKDDIAALTRELEQGLDAAERGLEAEFAKLRSRHGRADQDHPAAAGAQRPAPGVRGDGGLPEGADVPR
jgi:hypothetical protein